MSNERKGKRERKYRRQSLVSLRAEVSNIRKHIRSGDEGMRDASLERARGVCRKLGGVWCRLSDSRRYVKTYGF